MFLVERDRQLRTLGSYLDEAAAGHGRLVFVSGEAGIGKSALVAALTAAVTDRARVAVAYCDGSATPSPLAPLRELLPSLPAGVWPTDGTRAEIFANLVTALREVPGPRDPGPRLLVVEDAHWADQATLDLLLHLARRIHTCHALVVVTYRSEEVHGGSGLGQLLGDSASASGTRRLHVPALTRAAVADLVAAEVGRRPDAGAVDVARLHEITHGNAFYVTEVLSSGLHTIPDQCRDAILARVGNLSAGAQQAIEIVALAGARAEMDVLEELLDDGLDALDEALSRGLLVADEGVISFRHELARLVVDEHVPLGRRTHQHRRLFGALLARGADPARLAHHADVADLSERVLQHATVAGRRAAELGAHREAARQFERALHHAARLPAGTVPEEDVAELHWSLGYEHYVTGRPAAAADAVAAARSIWERQGRSVRVGDAWRCLSRLMWFEGRRLEAETAGQRALEVLEGVGGSPTIELGYAYSNMTQLRMLMNDGRATREWGARTLALVEALDDGPARTELRAHALNNLGTMEVVDGDISAGVAMLEESLGVSRRSEMHEHAARAYVNLASSAVSQRRFDDARRAVAEGLEYCTERDLDSWTLYLLVSEAELHLHTGDLEGAQRRARALLDHPSLPRASSMWPRVFLAHVQGRRGAGEVGPLVAEATAIADDIAEVQALAPVSAMRCELAWLDGRDADAVAIATSQLPLVDAADCRWSRGAVLRWLPPELRPRTHREVAEPYAAELAGRWEEAATLWERLGCPFDQGLVLARSGEPANLAAATAIFDGITAYAAAARCRAELRSAGHAVPRAPSRATRDHPHGLTVRESEVAELLARGLTDAAIADRLSISRRTAEHHVSSILAKLGLSSRRELAERHQSTS